MSTKAKKLIALFLSLTLVITMMPVQFSEAAMNVEANGVTINVNAPVAGESFAQDATISWPASDYLKADITSWTISNDPLKAEQKGTKAKSDTSYTVTIKVSPVTGSTATIDLDNNMLFYFNNDSKAISGTPTYDQSKNIISYTVSYTFAATKKTIKEVTITDLSAPSAGKTLDTDASCTGGAEISSITWYEVTKDGKNRLYKDEDMIAKYNTDYMVTIILRTGDGYYKFDDSLNKVSIKGTPNLVIPEQSGDQTQLTVSYTFSKTDGPKLKSIETYSVNNLPYDTTETDGIDTYMSNIKEVTLYTEDTSNTYKASVNWHTYKKSLETDSRTGNKTYTITGTVDLDTAHIHTDGESDINTVTVQKNDVSLETIATLEVLGEKTEASPTATDKTDASSSAITVTLSVPGKETTKNTTKTYAIYYSMTEDGSEPASLTDKNYSTVGKEYKNAITLSGEGGVTKTYRIKAVTVPLTTKGQLNTDRVVSANAEFTYAVSRQKEAIESVAVSGIEAPAVGKNLDTDALCNAAGVENGDNKSKISITWKISGATEQYTQARGNTAYTATVILKAKTGYYFASDVSVGGTVPDSKVTSKDGSSLTLTYKFDATDMGEVKSVTAPAKVGNITNGTSLADIIAQLPKTVAITTTDPSVTSAPVTWSSTLSGTNKYDPSLKTAQTFKLDGTVSYKNLGVTEPAVTNTKLFNTTIEVAVAAETIQDPVSDLAEGVYQTDQSVTLSLPTTDSSAKIYYTIDGKEPTNKSTVYSGPITLSGKEGEKVTYVLKAISYRDGISSNVVSYNYVIDIPKLKASVTFQANGGKGTMEAITVSVDHEVVVPECTFTAPNEKWCHSWAVNEPGGERIEAGSNYTFTDDTVLYAVWDDVLAENDTFTSGNGRYRVITTGEINKVEGTVAYIGQAKKRTTAKVPETVVYENITYLVTSVAKGAWRNNQALKKIVIGNNVTDIGEYAACNCTNLETLKLGDSVKSIGMRAFYKCSSLERVTIPASVTFIGSKAFRRCINLHTLNILTTNLIEGSVGYRAFPVRKTLINITVPESMIEAYQSLLPLKGVRQKAVLKINS